MGWKLKALAALTALLAFAFSNWLLGALMTIFLAASSLPLKKPQNTDFRAKRVGLFHTMPKRFLLGGFLLFLSFVAFSTGGTWSPLFYGIAGLLLISSRRIARYAHYSGPKAVNGTILFRSRLFPFHWVAVAEVKFATRQMAETLSFVDEELVIALSERPRTCIIFRTTGLTAKGVGAKLVEKMRRVARLLGPQGVYLLPMDAEEVVSVLKNYTEISGIDPTNLLASLSSLSYDLISIRPEGRFVRGVGIYERDGQGHRTVWPSPTTKLLNPVPVFDVLKAVQRKLSWFNPDERTVYLSGVLATRRVPEERKADEHSGSSSTKVLVSAAGSPPIELSRAQVEAIMTIYSWAD